METYKHFVTVTSQIYFCASPIRLDSYNRCQFGCVYCFSRNRATANSGKSFLEANVDAFKKRLERVGCAIIRSSLDEFLHRRVPIQLGGLQDPFSNIEKEKRVTFRLLQILEEHNYPTLISTKGDLVARSDYLGLLSKMNVYCRLSAAGVAEKLRANVDRMCSPFEATLRRIQILADRSIPVSLRIQPVIPGFENDALEMVVAAARAGVSHVSFEYLKIATERTSAITSRISRSIETDVFQRMQKIGVTKIGRDYTLVSEAKRDFLRKARQVCHENSVKFGAGDTEFIHLSDGQGCCNGSSFFLTNAHQFKANYTGVLSGKKRGSIVKFADVLNEWSPIQNVNTYMTTNSRGRDRSGKHSDWISLLAHRWNGGRSPYSPALFYGIKSNGHYDDNGYKIYTVEDDLG